MKLRLLLLTALAITAAARAADQPLLIDQSHSKIEVAVKFTAGSFVGHLADYDAAVLVAPGTGKITGATVRFRFVELKTGKAGRDKDMLEWLRHEQYPDGLFELSSLETVAGNTTARGKLTFHGVTKPVEFPVTVVVEGQGYTIDGEAVIDHRLFDLPVIRKFAFLKVDPLVKARFHLQGSLAAR